MALVRWTSVAAAVVTPATACFVSKNSEMPVVVPSSFLVTRLDVVSGARQQPRDRHAGFEPARRWTGGARGNRQGTLNSQLNPFCGVYSNQYSVENPSGSNSPWKVAVS